ncbi:hypothetical protein RHMOL_Rhmol02G0314900 [Rhododendron molle]|uniref:Uncharacterized protein n=1 Tax=Rhododendron molle TaxID=49168 RepID=A0ACC0PXL6_RHOML|nr:hypothetical protein RHMOL_Rhmol02G0314900 [Rhododendron molle]
MQESKKKGGLGIKRLLIQNAALLCKWWWRYGVEKLLMASMEFLGPNGFLPRLIIRADFLEYGATFAALGVKVRILRRSLRRVSGLKEDDELNELKQGLSSISLQPNVGDSLRWKWDSKTTLFPVKSCYEKWFMPFLQSDAPWLAIDDWDFCYLILLSLPMFILFAIKWFWRDCSAVNPRIVLNSNVAIDDWVFFSYDIAVPYMLKSDMVKSCFFCYVGSSCWGVLLEDHEGINVIMFTMPRLKIEKKKKRRQDRRILKEIVDDHDDA